MKLDEFVIKTFNPIQHIPNGSIFCDRPRIFCKNGFSMSVQGSSFHYCSPRETIDSYHAMEIGFPSRRVEKLKKYAEEPKRLTKTVYGWTPVKVIQEVIDDNGGIDTAKTFKKEKKNGKN